MKPIRTLVVDDSALVRRIVTERLMQDPGIEVVGTATDPYSARDKILALDPDVITLDIEMPRMDGLTFLKLIMKHRPMPVIIMSSLTQTGSEKALEALQSGAVDVIAKPAGAFSAVTGAEMSAKIKAAAQSRYRRQPHRTGNTGHFTRAALHPDSVAPEASGTIRSSWATPTVSAPVVSAGGARRHYPRRELILIGASTGGTEALKTVLTQLPPDLPGICIVQHIPAYFSRAFAERLNSICSLEISEAVQGDRVRSGRVLIAPGGYHLVLKWQVDHYSVILNEGPPVHHQRPAVDVMFGSAEKCGAAAHSLAILLTGMGADGAAGMLQLRDAGARTVAQSEESCVVFGMPREAIRLGAAQTVLHLDQIAPCIDRYAKEVARPPVVGNRRVEAAVG